MTQFLILHPEASNFDDPVIRDQVLKKIEMSQMANRERANRAWKAMVAKRDMAARKKSLFSKVFHEVFGGKKKGH